MHSLAILNLSTFINQTESSPAIIKCQGTLDGLVSDWYIRSNILKVVRNLNPCFNSTEHHTSERIVYPQPANTTLVPHPPHSPHVPHSPQPPHGPNVPHSPHEPQNGHGPYVSIIFGIFFLIEIICLCVDTTYPIRPMVHKIDMAYI